MQKRTCRPRSQVGLGNALAGEVPLPAEGVSAGSLRVALFHSQRTFSKQSFGDTCVTKCNLVTRAGYKCTLFRIRAASAFLLLIGLPTAIVRGEDDLSFFENK